MPKPIVVGYDPTTSDHTSVEFAVHLARLTRTRVVVASVQAASPVVPLTVGSQPVAFGQVDDDLVGDCTAALEELEQELGGAGVEVECRKLHSTSAARGLYELAEREEAALLVVGSSRHGALGRVVMGSTAARLVRGAPCPVSVVPRGWEARDAIETIGVAYVESEEARDALRGAHVLARRLGARLRVLTVVKPGVKEYLETEPSTDVRPGKGVAAVEGEERVRAEQAAREAVAALDPRVPVEVDAFIGDPAQTLIELSANLDLLVCGSRGYGPVRAVMLGSVSRRVAGDAHCPVIVLPRGVKDSLEELAAGVPAAAAGR